MGARRAVSVSEREWYEERAGILEFMAGMTRKDAESTARDMLIARGGSSVTHAGSSAGHVPSTLIPAANNG
jgi:hypothetical protein